MIHLCEYDIVFQKERKLKCAIVNSIMVYDLNVHEFAETHGYKLISSIVQIELALRNSLNQVEHLGNSAAYRARRFVHAFVLGNHKHDFKFIQSISKKVRGAGPFCEIMAHLIDTTGKEAYSGFMLAPDLSVAVTSSWTNHLCIDMGHVCSSSEQVHFSNLYFGCKKRICHIGDNSFPK